MKKIKIACKGAETAKLSDLLPFQGTLKSLSKEDLEKLKARILKSGFTAPFHIWKDGKKKYILDGHQRREALLSLEIDGYETGELPIDIIEAKTFKDAKETLLSHASNYGKMEGKGLIEFAKEAGLDLDLFETEFRFPEIHFPSLNGDDGEGNPGHTDADACPEVGDARVKPGDVWILGAHRLMCGSATVQTDMDKLMNGDKADCIITDPPYNVNYEGKTKEKLKIENDKMSDGTFYQFLLDAYISMYSHAKDGAAIYVFHADSEGMNFRKAMLDAQFKLAQCCIWVKQKLVMGRQDYHWQHEPVLYGWKPTGAHQWYSDRKQTTLWNFDRPSKNTDHPTMKPVALIEYPMKNSSKVGGIILDPFGGSGSTLIAAEKNGRVCRMMELDPKYCGVVLKRWEEFTKQKAELAT